MFSKLKKLTQLPISKKPSIDIDSIKDELCGGLFGVMENSFSQRQSDKHNSQFSESDVDKIIKMYAKRNMVLAAASSIVPGPFGILSAVPELLLNFGNQMNMIYDLGCAHGKEGFINKDVLLDIPFAAFGGNTNLSALQADKTDLLDSSKELLMGKATALGQNLIEKSLKKSIVQFIPVAGPILMTTWAKMTTHKISKSSVNFLDGKQVYKEHFKKEETEELKIQLQIEKIKGLTNLIEANNDINENQIEFISPIIQNARISDKDKAFYMEEALKAGSNFELDYDLLKEYEEDETLLMELVILAKRTGIIDKYEKEYIHKVGSALKQEEAFIEELF